MTASSDPRDTKHGPRTDVDSGARDPHRPDTEYDESTAEGRRTVADSVVEPSGAMTISNPGDVSRLRSNIYRQSIGTRRFPAAGEEDVVGEQHVAQAEDIASQDDSSAEDRVASEGRLEPDEREGQRTVLDTQDKRAGTDGDDTGGSGAAECRLDKSLNIRSRPVSGNPLFGGGHPSDYRIVRKLAEGGMGVVYVARQTSLDRELAIKTLRPMKPRPPSESATRGRVSEAQRQRREMFLSEALVTANLVHPHIVPIHDLCQTDDGLPFYAMEHVHGKPWDERMAVMPLPANLDVLLKVADAVAYAHHHGVVNRDLKPENVMLGDFGEVVVLDWGLAMPAADVQQRQFQSPAAAIGAGTPAYMAPELWTGPAEAIGTWSDIYLLGAILFEIITGEPPHEFPDPPENANRSVMRKLIDDVVRPNTIRPTSEKAN
ncbi:MAG: serine/threonine-protein kinase [Planctomycetaceae bacterium]